MKKQKTKYSSRGLLKSHLHKNNFVFTETLIYYTSQLGRYAYFTNIPFGPMLNRYQKAESSAVEIISFIRNRPHWTRVWTKQKRGKFEQNDHWLTVQNILLFIRLHRGGTTTNMCLEENKSTVEWTTKCLQTLQVKYKNTSKWTMNIGLFGKKCNWYE